MANVPNPRHAVIAIQGGGVYGLTLLGQLKAVIEDYGYEPLALAGTSAGAVVAVLVWAGYSPTEIAAIFARMADAKSGTLRALFGPHPKGTIDPEDLGPTIRKLARTGSALWKWGLPSLLFHGVGAYFAYRRLKPHVKLRGLFSGQELENQIDTLIRDRLGISERILPANEPVRFEHVIQHIRAERALVNPPLMLTVTNLSTRRLELISSFEEQYAKVPVAKAVRASAGVPVFFTPQDLPECPDGGWFVDGGLVANFPLWAFSDLLRSRIRKSANRDLYAHLVNMPWLRIGLRTLDDAATSGDLSEPSEFFKSLGLMLVGDSRNQLEEMLTREAPRSLVVPQKYSDSAGPSHFLAVKEVTPKRVREMVRSGRSYAANVFAEWGSPGIFSERSDLEARVTEILRALVERSELILPVKLEQGIRTNVFLPDMEVNRLVFAYNMDGHGDRNMEFPDLFSGATGLCYTRRRPIICNLKAVGEMRNGSPVEYEQMYGMDPVLQGSVNMNQTWLLSFPIFDPYEVRHSTQVKVERGTPLYDAYAYRELDCPMDGPVLGVLNLDVAIDYEAMGLDPSPNVHFSDKRIAAVVAIIESGSLALASEIAEGYPPQRKDAYATR